MSLSFFFFFDVFRHGNKGEGGDSGTPKAQNHTNEQSPPRQDDPPQQEDAPDVPETDTVESETEQEGAGRQLSSSVVVDMSHVQASLELSTITGPPTP